MTRWHWLPCALLSLVAAPAAHALRCDGNIMHGGEYDYQVREHCGEPFWTDARVTYETYGTDREGYTREVQYTTWYYNFGSNQFMVRLVFRDGHLEHEETLRRGVDEIGASCDLPRVPRNLTGGELVAYCGEPTSRYRQAGQVYRSLNPYDRGYGPHYQHESEQDSEDWLYDFGGDSLYIAHVFNGNVSGIERRPR